MSTYIEKREFLAESIRLLSTHEPFKQFMASLGQLRDSAIQDAVRNDVVGNPQTMAAALGEVRTYLDIFALVEEHAPKELE